MNVLVAHASRHGSTAAIAERIAATLLAEGVTAEARPVAEVRDLAGYDAFVVGAAAYLYHWLGDATKFVKRHRDELHEMLGPRDERVFFGAWDPNAPAIGMPERLMGLMPASKKAIPAGDFRDWPAIDAWAVEIASALRPTHD